MDADLVDLRWWRLRVTLECRRSPPPPGPHLLEVAFALVKQARGEGFDPRRAFRLPGTRIRGHQTPRSGRRYPIEIVLFDPDANVRGRWREAFLALADHTDHSNFAVVEFADFEERSLACVPELRPDHSMPLEEVRLDFHSPMRFKPPSKPERLRLTESEFLDTLERHLSRLFGRPLRRPVEAHEITLLPYYWHYQEIRHRSRSQLGTREYYSGCVGPLFARGRLEPLLPWLQIAQEVNLGGKLDVNPFGYFELTVNPPPWFESALYDRQAMAETAAELLGRDDATEELVERLGSTAGPAQLAERAVDALQRPEQGPDPSEAFRLPKRSARGGTRIVERLTLLEKTIQRRLLELITPVVDNALHPSSVGFRRGRSREQAVARVRELVSQGFRYAVQSDIEDCFPSVDLERLDSRLVEILPRADRRLLDILRQRLKMPYLMGGELHERSSGLAQGAPLSPLLANLYLDRFDQSLADQRGVLIRYADDFVIMCRTRADAEAMLHDAEGQLAQLGLDLSDTKTGIRSIDEGFRFLGETFDEKWLDDVGETVLAQRKPLLITEPFCLLSVNGDALDIRRDGKLLDTLPLRRISEIVVLGKAVFSSSLVERCQRLRIPISFALDTGYQIGMFTPDARRFHDIAYRQSRKYYDLSETERVSIAQQIAQTKIHNYSAFLRQRYVAGDAALLLKLKRCSDEMASCSTVAQIRGHEGLAARLVFGWLNGRIKDPRMRSPKREREPADRLNALLNFGYYLSWSRLNGLLRSTGVNPYLGFLHDAQDNFETLVADLQELFRAHVDRLVLRVINTEVVTHGDFDAVKGGLRIARPAVRRFALHFEREMQRRLPGSRMTISDMQAMQVRCFRAFMLDEGPLWLYRWADRLPTAGDDSAPDEADSDVGAGE